MIKIILYLVGAFYFILPISSSPAAEKIKVASIFAKTGPAAAGNLSAIEGVRFAVKKLNKQGGLLERQVEIVELDNHSTALHSKRAAEEAVRHGVTAVFGANWSSHSLAMAPVFQAAKIPMLAIYSTNPDVTRAGDYIFRVCFIDSFQGQIMSNFAFRDLKARKAAILVNASGRYSEGLADFFQKDFLQRGGEILFKSDYLHDAKIFKPLLEKIIFLKPDVVFVPGNIVDSGRIINQARDMGLTVPFLGGDGWGDSMYAYAGSKLHGSYFSVHWHPENESKKSREFLKEFSDNFDSPADSGTALAYDAVFLFAKAAARVGSLDPQKIQKEIAMTQDFQGVTGEISFNRNRNPIKPAVILKFDKKTAVYVKTVQP